MLSELIIYYHFYLFIFAVALGVITLSSVYVAAELCPTWALRWEKGAGIRFPLREKYFSSPD